MVRALCLVPCACYTVFITLCSNFHKPFFIVVGSSTVSSNHLLRVLYYILKMKSTEKNGSSPPTYCSGRTTSQPASQQHTVQPAERTHHILKTIYFLHTQNEFSAHYKPIIRMANEFSYGTLCVCNIITKIFTPISISL